jgi:hypothetical protein
MLKLVSLPKRFVPLHLTVDERRKRQFLALFLGLLTPALALIGLLNSRTGSMATANIGVWLGVFFGIVSLLALRYLANLTPMFYVGFTVTLAILTYQAALGTGEGMAFLWFYFFPLSTFFLFGKWKGLLWVVPSWLIALLLLLFNVGPYHYPNTVAIRFIITYTLVCIFSYAIEALRSQYYSQLQREKAALEVALQQVKTLHGLLPICASCKKIRDDGGYWHQVEAYLSEHTEVQFSHGICPDCRATLYAQLRPAVDPGNKRQPPAAVSAQNSPN